MEKKARIIRLCLLIGVILAACGPSQAERNVLATKMAANTFATQTAETPILMLMPTDTSAITPTRTPVFTPTPSRTPRPTATHTPEPTPIPPLVAGWDSLPLERICVEVEENYPGCPELNMRIAESVSKRLERSAGVRTADPCDATLTVSITATSIKKKYSVSGSTEIYECYNGCQVSGKMVLSANGHRTLTATITKRIEPRKSIPQCEEDACAHNALGCLIGIDNPLDDMLASLWGMTLDDWLFSRR